MNLSDNSQLIAIYTNIGRGHPSYLDSLLETLQENGQKVICRTVLEESDGLSLLAWKLVEKLYLFGGKGGIRTRLYNWLRGSQTDVSSDSALIKLLGRDLREKYQDFRGICLVAHPVVARILRDVCRTWYVHGEIAAPLECAVKGVEKIFVPLEETKQRLISFGADPGSIVVTALMIEPGLVETAEESFQARLKRIESDEPLNIGFFTSGAYPKEHMKKILWGAKSVADQGMRAIIFTGTCPKKFEWFNKRFQKWKLSIVQDRGEASGKEKDGNVWLITRETRQAETQRAVELVPQMDAFVAASHERTNWAVGSGLPMFVLFPLIGTFASLNFEFAERQEVAYPLDSLEKTQILGKIISEIRQNGQLSQMAHNGFGVHRMEGVRQATSHLLS